MPPRVNRAVKAGLLGLIDGAVDQGWSAEHAGEVLGVGARRVQRWRLRLVTNGELADRPSGGNPLHRILPEEEQAVLAVVEEWGPIDRPHRKLAHRGSYLHRGCPVRC